MSKREDYKRFIVFCLASLVVLAQAAVFAWVWYSVYRGQIDEPFWRKGNWVLIAIYGLMFALFAKLYGGLKVGYLKRIDVFYSLTLALFVYQCGGISGDHPSQISSRFPERVRVRFLTPRSLQPFRAGPRQ